MADAAARAVARYFRDARPGRPRWCRSTASPGPRQLVEIELDAVDGAGASARRISSGGPLEDVYAYSRAVRVGDRVFISGSTALKAGGVVEGPGDMYRQTRATMDTILRALAEAGGAPGDLVYTKTFLTDLGKTAEYTRAFVDALGDVRPDVDAARHPGTGAPGDAHRDRGGGHASAPPRARRDIYTEHLREKPRGYARAVAVGDQVYVSGCTSVSSSRRGAGAGRLGPSVRPRASTRSAGRSARPAPSLDDVVRRRTFTVEGTTQNRAHGEGPAPFAKSHPTSLGCRISGLARPELLVEVEVTAIKGAGAGIQWIGPDVTDPLDT